MEAVYSFQIVHPCAKVAKSHIQCHSSVEPSKSTFLMGKGLNKELRCGMYSCSSDFDLHRESISSIWVCKQASMTTNAAVSDIAVWQKRRVGQRKIRLN